MQLRKLLISDEINYDVCRIKFFTPLPPEGLVPTPDHAECPGGGEMSKGECSDPLVATSSCDLM